MADLLVVDDDSRIRKLLSDFLTQSGHDVRSAGNAAEARSILATTPIDVIVLDIMMPGEDGVSLTQSLREHGHAVGIILLTARDGIDDRVKGLDSGADDYLTKPFDPKELLARINVMLRRKSASHPSVIQTSLKLGGMSFDLAKGLLKDGEESIFLTSSELNLMKFLAQSPRKPFSREELAQRIGHRVSERSVDVQIVRLRRKLNDDPRKPKYLQTVRHIGYGLYPDEA